MSNKKYFWIKLKKDFFDLPTIDWLLEQEKGCEYVVLYQKLCLLTANNNGELSRRIGKMIIPYDVKKIAEVTKFNCETIDAALKIYEKIGLIFAQKNGMLTISNIDEMVGSETESAIRMRRSRKLQKIASQCDNNVTKEISRCDEDIESELELDIESDIDKELDTELELKKHTLARTRASETQNPKCKKIEIQEKSKEQNAVETDQVYIAANENAVETGKVYIAANENAVETNGVYIAANEGAVETDKVYIAANENAVETNGVYIAANENAVETGKVYIAANEGAVETNGVYIAAHRKKRKGELSKKQQAQFDELWAIYPNKQGKTKAMQYFKRALNSGSTFEEMLLGLRNYNFYIKAKGLEQRYIKHGATWFSQKCWLDDYTVYERENKRSRRETLSERNNRVFEEYLARSENGGEADDESGTYRLPAFSGFEF